MAKYKKGSAWKRTHWDRWTFGRKVLHCLAVIASLILVSIMCIGTAYLFLVVFEFKELFNTIIDGLLLGFAHLLFD